jgi:hypothetical protein
MYNDLEERTQEHYTNTMIICATFLDPRYRQFHFIKDEREREKDENDDDKIVNGVVSEKAEIELDKSQ